MASFLENLWLSIFTPGPTRTLLIATNAAFASLQFLLLVLLIATYSIHFVILSLLCAGLWWSINWFSVELVRDAERKKKEEQEKGDRGVDKGGLGKDKEGEGGSETETESVDGGAGAGKGEMRPPPRPRQDVSGGAGSGTGTGLRPDTGGEDALRRRSVGDSSGYVSTDSEWEKVDDEKDR
jgi:hypothetical protein